MRPKLVLAALGLGAVGALLPASSASAQCIHVVGLPGCYSPHCTVVGLANTADDATVDAFGPFVCTL